MVTLLIGGVCGGLIGYAIASNEAEQEREQALTALRDEVAEFQSDVDALEQDNSALGADKAALEASLATMTDQVGVCQVAAAMAQQIIENRQQAIDISTDPSLPADPLDAAWSEVGDALLRLDSEFARIVGRFDVAAAVCVAPSSDVADA